jgi:hypothetical protein
MAKNLNKIFGHVYQVETITPSDDGTTSAYTKSPEAMESGTTYFVDISTNTVSVKLPTTKLVAGVWFKFVLATASDDEGTKDFILTTGSDSTDFGGTIRDGGGLVEVTSATSKITIDSSEGAATVGDFITCVYDGTDWYVEGVILNDGALAIADGI